MKNLFPIVLFLILPIVSKAQFQKGLKQIGGAVSFFQNQIDNEYASSTNFANIGEQTVTQVRVIPRIGFFVNDNTSFGFGIGYGHDFNNTILETASQQIIESESKTNTVELEVFSRFHKSISDNFYLFVQPTISGSFGNTINGVDEDFKERVIGFGIAVSPGMVFMLNENFGLEAAFGALGYNRTSTTPTEPDIDLNNVDSNFGLDFTLRSFQLGLQHYF